MREDRVLSPALGNLKNYPNFSLATQRSWKSADEEWHSKTEWHRVIAWNGLGEYAAAKLRKGGHIYVEGTLVSSTYEKETSQLQPRFQNALTPPIAALLLVFYDVLPAEKKEDKIAVCK